MHLLCAWCLAYKDDLLSAQRWRQKNERQRNVLRKEHFSPVVRAGVDSKAKCTEGTQKLWKGKSSHLLKNWQWIWKCNLFLDFYQTIRELALWEGYPGNQHMLFRSFMPGSQHRVRVNTGPALALDQALFSALPLLKLIQSHDSTRWVFCYSHFTGEEMESH